MLINAGNLETAFKAFDTTFNKGVANAPSHYRDIAMITKSDTSEEEYGWLGETPNLREWVGDRIIHGLTVHGYTLRNKTFESTVSIKRTTFEDDRYGIYGPIFEKMGRDAAMHPDELVFHLLSAGFHEPCFDGQPFFDDSHPVENNEETVLVSNIQAGSQTPWFLLDCSQPIRPLVWQERLPYEFQRMDESSDHEVFMRDQFYYGTRGRGSAGYGLWQLAFGSKAELNATNYEAARTAMHGLRGENGKKLGISPTHLVVPPSLEGKARALLTATHLENGATNIWSGSASLLMTSFLD